MINDGNKQNLKTDTTESEAIERERVEFGAEREKLAAREGLAARERDRRLDAATWYDVCDGDRSDIVKFVVRP
ncbi:hypothetical protein TSUD_290010 [Trifolium subterraneum]|uniref:Uncharacterized protein n=1 Tax=Trifolium subterraneum TaxID=3900 RepID=A0A2Z6NU62_TRISU|nr:hypothetical protein TSUD_290010 [Trifolium subterraneum]